MIYQERAGWFILSFIIVEQKYYAQSNRDAIYAQFNSNMPDSHFYVLNRPFAFSKTYKLFKVVKKFSSKSYKKLSFPTDSASLYILFEGFANRNDKKRGASK